MIRAMGIALVLLHAAPRVTTAQDVTTKGGVYSTAQAERGRIVYAGFCRSCHSPASHSGATFEKLWSKKTLGDLYGYVTTSMPKSDPGGLEPVQYADVMAYLLKMNALPAGKVELPADSAALALIRIELPTKKATVARKAQPTKPKKGA